MTQNDLQEILKKYFLNWLGICSNVNILICLKNKINQEKYLSTIFKNAYWFNVKNYPSAGIRIGIPFASIASGSDDLAFYLIDRTVVGLGVDFKF